MIINSMPKLNQSQDANLSHHNNPELNSRNLNQKSLISQSFKKNSSSVNPDWRGFLGETPLIYFCEDNNYRAAKNIIKLGANVNAADFFGNTPLHNAAHKGHLEIVQLLVENGAKIEARNLFNKTPLDKAKNHKEVYIYLSQVAEEQKQLSNDRSRVYQAIIDILA